MKKLNVKTLYTKLLKTWIILYGNDHISEFLKLWKELKKNLEIE